jgi:hypothetical protein
LPGHDILSRCNVTLAVLLRIIYWACAQSII